MNRSRPLHRPRPVAVFTYATAAIAVLTLSACGGGAADDSLVAATPSNDAASSRVRLQAVAPTQVWTKCADEGGLCAFTGTKAMRYGKGSQWSETLIFQAGPMGGAPCKPDTSFNGDPAPNVVKECQISDVTGDNHATRATQGEWEALQAWPIVPVHISLLPSGRLVAHNATNDDLWPQLSVLTQVWDPVAKTLTAVDARDSTLMSELFCVGFAHLPDGSLLTSGNQPNDKLDYDRNANRFNFFTQTWSREADTAFYRYYPSMATLGNGDMISFGGTKTTAPAEVMRSDGSWKTLSGMTFFQDFNYYPWGQTAPNGKLFYAGPDDAMRYIDPAGAGAMAELGKRDSLARNYGSYAMYDVGKLLIAGGAQPATNSAVVVDINGSAPVVSATGSMANARRHGNLTILADGSVLATGGYAGSEFTDISANQAVLQAERWSPTTGTWSPMASAQRQRAYHSVGILLADGRVAVGGGGMPFNTGYNQENVEIFSPPYLFQSGGYNVKTGLTGTVGCNNATFGDPLPGVAKACSWVTGDTNSPTAPPADAIQCANENGSCALPAGGLATVYYGANGIWTQKVASGTVACNNATFGDPIYGVVKSCRYRVAPTRPATAVACAAENASCVVPQGTTATVWYGASGKFVAKTAQAGTVACTNANFADPIPGTVKACSYEVSSTSGTASSLPSNAQTCASENGNCVIPAGVTATVYFGAGSQPAPRPTITYAPDSLGYGAGFIVTASAASPIAKAHLIKLGAVTHANNQGQRLVPLKFSASGSNLQVTAPADPNVAPPGYYMLFVVDAKGVPSVARMVQLQQHAVVTLVSRRTGEALETMPGSTGAGTALRMAGGTETPDLAKAWDLLPTDNGYFKLVSRANGFVLTVPGSSLQSGAAVQAQPDVSGSHQQWLPARSTLGYVTLKARHSSMALQVAGGGAGEGAGVVQQSLSGAPSPNDEWVIVPFGHQRLVGVQSGKVAEVVGRSSSAGSGIAIAPNRGDTHQAFRFVPRADGYMSIEASHSGSVLGVAGGGTQPTAVLQQQTWTAATAQQWTLLPQKDGSFMLQVRHSGQYMNVLNDKVDTGTPIGQYPDNGGLPNQYWRLIPSVSLDPHQRSVSGRAIAAAHVAGVGWLPYVAASNTIGQSDGDANVEAVKISVKGLRSGLQISYRTQGPDGVWDAWKSDDQQAGVTGQSTPIQAFQAVLGGTRDSCSVRYRGRVKGVGWQTWAAEGETAGVAAVATPLTGLQVFVECTSQTLAYKP